MDEARLIAALVAAVIATIGLWWFGLIMKNVRALPRGTRYGIYALIWLAYFVAAMLVIGGAGA